MPRSQQYPVPRGQHGCIPSVHDQHGTECGLTWTLGCYLCLGLRCRQPVARAMLSTAQHSSAANVRTYRSHTSVCHRVWHGVAVARADVTCLVWPALAALLGCDTPSSAKERRSRVWGPTKHVHNLQQLRRCRRDSSTCAHAACGASALTFWFT